MRSTAETLRPWRRYALERALAPHVNQTWAESFILELRLLGVAGDRIGAALSEVESHCSESEQGAEHAFGPPVAYARTLQLPIECDQSPPDTLRSVAPIMVQVLGMILLNVSFGGWLRGQQLEITTGVLVSAAVGFVAMAAVVPFVDALLRLAVYHWIRCATLMTVVSLVTISTSVAALMYLDATIWHASAGWGLATGATVMAGGVSWALVRLRRDGSEADLITSPFENPDSTSGGEASGRTCGLFRSSLILTLTHAGMIPVATVVLLATSLMLHQMTAG